MALGTTPAHSYSIPNSGCRVNVHTPPSLDHVLVRTRRDYSRYARQLRGTAVHRRHISQPPHETSVPTGQIKSCGPVGTRALLTLHTVVMSSPSSWVLVGEHKTVEQTLALGPAISRMAGPDDDWIAHPVRSTRWGAGAGGLPVPVHVCPGKPTEAPRLAASCEAPARRLLDPRGSGLLFFMFI